MHKRERLSAILVDGSNIFATVRALGFLIDYQKLLQTFDGTVLKAYYFTALRAADKESAVKPLVDHLQYNGWTCITKPTSEWIQEDGRNKIKGNMDIEIATIAHEIAPHITDLYLFTGDGDFTFLVEALQRRYFTVVHVVSSMQTQPPMCADTLRRQADEFLEVLDMKDMIKRDEDELAMTRRRRDRS